MLKDKVYEYLKTIPKGRVVTYSQIGKALNTKGYRAIGNILHNNPDPITIPCYKVVNKKGFLAKNFAYGIENQKKWLQNDGVEVVGERVDLKKYQWKN